MTRRDRNAPALALESLEQRVVLDAGLVGEYFNDTNLTQLASTRVDPTIDFLEVDWGNAPPGTGVAADDSYSERWTGQVKIDTTGSWTFSTISNDGVRLWINDQLIIDNWNQHVATEDQATINLTAGWHDIRLEHFQLNGTVAMQLSFAGPQQTKTIIPSTHLRTEAPEPEPEPGPVEFTGDLKQWHPQTLTFSGPAVSENDSVNPFLNYRLNVTFVGPDGSSHVVAGYYAADGNAAETSATSGNKWRVHFVPDQAGTWTWTASFRTGTNVAVSMDPNAGTATSFDGASDSFEIGSVNPNSGDPLDRGTLRYVGERYLRYAGSGEAYLKNGADSPENFLGYYEFDNTFDNGGAANDLLNGLHHYDPHLQDWNPGDPTWQNGEGKRIIGALNYLASQDVNSLYFLTYNIDGGDGREVWPWTTTNNKVRFDVSKLAQWEIVFSHMDRLGMQLHVVTQETENDQGINGGSLGVERMLYYRELVARFAHHQAVNWNLGEENTNTSQQLKDFSNYIRALDPYDHQIVVHTFPGQKSQIYTPMLGHPNLDGASLQASGSDTHAQTINWLDQSAAAGRQWVVTIDEIGPASAGVVPDSVDATHDSVRKDHLWASLMAGGAGAEWYFGYNYPHSDLDAEDFRSRENMWEQTDIAVDFFMEHLPFTEMSHADNLTAVTNDYVLADPGDTYAIYLKTGGTTTLNLSGESGTFEVKWFNPRTGGSLQNGTVTSVVGGGNVALGNAPSQTNQDWVVLVRRTGPAPTSQVTGFVLVNADTDTDIGPLVNGSTINLATLGTTNLNVRAVVSGSIGSIRFDLDGQVGTQIENIPAYALFGNTGNDYDPGSFSLGGHTLTATPFSASGANGTAGTALSISFTVINQAEPPSGGLQAEYFNNINLTGLASTRVDSMIDFNEAMWGDAPPGTGIIADDTYSERWSGQVKVDTAGTWTFSTLSNDGVRVWINDQLVIDHWDQHAVTEDSVTLSLSEGWHSIRLEHFQQNGTVAIQLSFAGPGQTKTVIPPSHLSPQSR
jgi:hypothetical protein